MLKAQSSLLFMTLSCGKSPVFHLHACLIFPLYWKYCWPGAKYWNITVFERHYILLCRSCWGHASTSEIVQHACNRQSFALWAEDRGRKEEMARSFMGWARHKKLHWVLIMFSAGSWVTKRGLLWCYLHEEQAGGFFVWLLFANCKEFSL